MSKSSLALSNVRGFVIVLIIAFHSCIAYLGSAPVSLQPFDSPPYTWKGFPIVDSARWFGFDLFCAVVYVFMMQFMFFLSGLFVWPSLLRKGAKKFLYDRFLRLGVPFVLGAYLLMPVVHYPVYLVRAADPSWSAFWTHLTALPFWPTAQLWFLWYLLVLDILAAALYWFAPRAGELLARLSAANRPSRYLILLVAISALGYVPLAIVFKPWQWIEFGPFSFQPSIILIYIIYFLAGIGLGAHGIDRGLLATDGLLARRWVAWLAGAFAGFLLWIIPTAASMNTQGATAQALAIVADFAFVLSCALSCFAVLAVFLHFPKHSPVLDSLSQNAYGIYLVHSLFVIWLQYSLLSLPLFAVFKGAIVFTVGLMLSWATSIAICRLPIGARLVGTERRVWAKARGSQAASEHARIEA